MFPIRDHNPSTTRPFVTWALMAINVTIFLGNASLGDQALAQIYHDFGIIPAQLSSGQGYGTLVSSMFLHGGILHLAGNMLFLWIFGDNLEDAMGHVGYLAFYLACGIGAGLAQVAAAPQSYGARHRRVRGPLPGSWADIYCSTRARASIFWSFSFSSFASFRSRPGPCWDCGFGFQLYRRRCQ